MIGYIYKVVCLNNNKVYIGQTRQSIQRRWSQHKSKAGKINTPFYNAIQKYGKKSFIVSIVKTVYSEKLEELKSILNKKEIFYTNYYKALHPEGYTLVAGGMSLSKEASKRIGEATAKRNKTKAHREANSKGLKQAYKNGLDNKGIVSIHQWQENNKESMLAIRRKAVVEAQKKANTKEAKEKRSLTSSNKYIITNPENIQFCVIGLNWFCKNNNLDVSTLNKVVKGKRKSHKGYKASLII